MMIHLAILICFSNALFLFYAMAEIPFELGTKSFESVRYPSENATMS